MQTNHKKTKLTHFSSLLFLFLISNLSWAGSAIYTGFLSDLAVSGYDPVAYFTQNKPIKGKKAFSSQYQGAQWRFSSAEHKAMFDADPSKYAPQYGGYCAWAVANNDTAKGDPQQWTIFNEKLYLNYDTSIQNKWLKDKQALIVKADKNWPGVIQ